MHAVLVACQPRSVTIFIDRTDNLSHDIWKVELSFVPNLLASVCWRRVFSAM